MPRPYVKLRESNGDRNEHQLSIYHPGLDCRPGGRVLRVLPTGNGLRRDAGNGRGDPRTIIVSGASEVRIVPDEVILTVGVETVHVDMETAKAENDAMIERLLTLSDHLTVNLLSR